MSRWSGWVREEWRSSTELLFLDGGGQTFHELAGRDDQDGFVISREVARVADDKIGSLSLLPRIPETGCRPDRNKWKVPGWERRAPQTRP